MAGQSHAYRLGGHRKNRDKGVEDTNNKNDFSHKCCSLSWRRKDGKVEVVDKQWTGSLREWF
jgi:hypothetical protein